MPTSHVQTSQELFKIITQIGSSKMMPNNCLNCFIYNNNFSNIIELILANYLQHQVFYIQIIV